MKAWIFLTWFRQQSVQKLEEIFYQLAEEPKAKKLAQSLFQSSDNVFLSAQSLADFISKVLAYSNSKRHPATRIFQAFRMAVNGELEDLKSMLDWAPEQLAPGGRVAIISFHSLEDRLVKKKWLALEATEDFVILTKKPSVPNDEELEVNPRSRSAKLRVLERVGDGTRKRHR
jgi:16S rRNA (cytosine1402-N4)-methyltransferase